MVHYEDRGNSSDKNGNSRQTKRNEGSKKKKKQQERARGAIGEAREKGGERFPERNDIPSAKRREGRVIYPGSSPSF